MEEKKVDYETAKRLKELGFDWPTTYCIMDGGDYFETDFVPRDWNKKGQPKLSSAPTLSRAVAWLRKVKNIDVLINKGHGVYGYEIISIGYCGGTLVSFDHDVALMEGINKSLEKL